MSIAEAPHDPSSDQAVIDLRNGATVTDSTVTGEPSDDVGDRRAPTKEHRGRQIVLIVLLSLVAVIVIDIVLGSVAHTERQRHLADEFRERDGAAELEAGDASYVLQIPDIGFNQVVIEGATAGHLRGGPARRLDSATVGDGGNTVIMGRSTRFSGPFEQLGSLSEGDAIALQARDGTVTAYEVASVEKVDGDQVEVLQRGDEDRLTLVASAGGPLSSRRVVVVAEPAGAVSEAEEAEAAEAAAEDAPAGEEERDDAAAEARAADEADLAFDQRDGARVLLVAGLVVLALGVVVANELRRRYSPLTVVVVAGPAVALGLALFLFNVDGFLPTTY